MKKAPIYFRGFLCLLILGMSSSTSRAQQDMPATEPTTQPTDAQINDWLNQLADVDPDVRESGVQALMGLTRDDLPRLRAIAKAQGPLMPGQSAALQDVVKQVYLSGVDEPVTPERGLLGLHWPLETTVQGNAQGIPVVDRIPGFPAYRLLHEGDLIIAVENHPEIDAHYVPSFIDGVRALKAGDVLLLNVQRGGHLIQVPVSLARCPVEISGTADPDPWRNHRETQADDYWTANFANLDSNSTSPSTQP